MKGRLLLIPTSLTQDPLVEIHSEKTLEKIREIEVFVVETHKIGRRNLQRLYEDKKVGDLDIFEYSNKSPRGTLEQVLELLKEGKKIGYMSDAGYPAVADDGGKLVMEAQRLGAKIKALSGPSSLIQTLAASGLNGQNFEFVGYLPSVPELRETELKKLEEANRGKAIIFIETPYRAGAMHESILRVLEPRTKLAIGKNIDTDYESVKTKTIEQWNKEQKYKIGKDQVVFIIQS